MLVLNKNNIIDLYVWIDDWLPQSEANISAGGRPKLLTESEVITIMDPYSRTGITDRKMV